MMEQWIPWKPMEGLGLYSSINSVTHNDDGLKIVLSEDEERKKRVLVYFEGYIPSFRDSDESYRLQLISNLRAKYPEQEGNFFKVNNSAYLKWISEQSYGVSDLTGCIHFAILSDNIFLDIIARFEPKIYFLDATGEIENPPIIDDIVIWEITPHIKCQYQIERVTETHKTVEFILTCNQNKKIKILFESFAAFFRVDKQYTIEMIVQSNGKYGVGFYKTWPFFKLLNSSYLAWLTEQRVPSENLTHFTILLDNQCYHIASSKEPTITYLDI